MRKRIVNIVVIALIVLVASMTVVAQEGATLFYGMPVDGSKQVMIGRLQEKGFVYDSKKDELTGSYLEKQVRIRVVTKGNKVWRIMVVDAVGSDAKEIKKQFNRLGKAFNKSGKYMPISNLKAYEIGHDEDVAKQMSVNSKKYSVGFYQYDEADKDTTGMARWVQQRIEKTYLSVDLSQMDEKERQNLEMKTEMEFILQKIRHKSVWYTIQQQSGKYYLVMFFDNKLNQ